MQLYSNLNIICQIQMHVGNMSIHTEFEIHTDLK